MNKELDFIDSVWKNTHNPHRFSHNSFLWAAKAIYAALTTNQSGGGMNAITAQAIAAQAWDAALDWENNSKEYDDFCPDKEAYLNSMQSPLQTDAGEKGVEILTGIINEVVEYIVNPAVPIKSLPAIRNSLTNALTQYNQLNRV